jgi:hypothetical protein
MTEPLMMHRPTPQALKYSLLHFTVITSPRWKLPGNLALPDFVNFTYQ